MRESGINPPTSEHLVCYLLPNFMGGGAERAALNIMQSLPDLGHRLVLFEDKIEYACDAPVSLLKGNPLVGGPALRRLRLVGENVAALFGLKKRFARGTWISFTTVPNVMNALTPSSARVVLSSQNRESGSIGGRWGGVLKRLVSIAYPRADVIVAASDSVKDDLVEHFGVAPGKIVTIHNTVDLDAIAAQQDAAIEGPLAQVLACPTIVTAGRLTEQKGQWHLIRSFSAVKQRVPEAKLVVIGKGPLGPYLAGVGRELGLRVWTEWDGGDEEMLRADLVFPGFLSNPFAIFAGASVFAFTSLWEGFGNVIIEAMACGVPTVVADCKSGPREIVSPESPKGESSAEPMYASAGILMPALDGVKRGASEPLTPAERAWAEALQHVVEDAGLRQRYRERGLERARDFSTVATARKWRAVLLGDTGRS